MRRLPDRLWRLPRHEDDESAAEEGTGRVLALSDGVFAVAITLLIFEIAVPATTSDADLGKALLGLWPRYLAYVVSFVVIARFWMTHRLAFRLIVRDDAGRAQVRGLRARGVSSPVFFALTLPIAVLAPYAAEITWVLIFPLTWLVFVWFFADNNGDTGPT